MRLINVETLKLEAFLNEKAVEYAILSHRWQDGEVSYQDFQDPALRSSKPGFSKIFSSCEQAAEDGLRYLWCDTCCINQDSLTELSESINSMFRLYQNSKVCYAFLSDVDVGTADDEDLEPLIAASKWFTRGWTLQELLAPKQVNLFDSHWKFLGTKQSLGDVLEAKTGIEQSVLNGGSLDDCSIAQRMSWASHRATTRPEDTAYCLLGIFNVSMPLLYGEGERAFLRLQEEIIKYSDDHSIFAWQMRDEIQTGLLAASPAAFAGCGQIRSIRRLKPQLPFSMTNRGLSICLKAEPITPTIYVALLDCFDSRYGYPSTGFCIAIFLRRLWSENQYCRVMHKGQSRPIFNHNISPLQHNVSRPLNPFDWRDRDFFVMQAPSTELRATSDDLLRISVGESFRVSNAHTRPLIFNPLLLEAHVRGRTQQGFRGPTIRFESIHAGNPIGYIELLIDSDLDVVCFVQLQRRLTISTVQSSNFATRLVWHKPGFSLFRRAHRSTHIKEAIPNRFDDWTKHDWSSSTNVKLHRGLWALKGDHLQGFQIWTVDMERFDLRRIVDYAGVSHWSFYCYCRADSSGFKPGERQRPAMPSAQWKTEYDLYEPPSGG